MSKTNDNRNSLIVSGSGYLSSSPTDKTRKCIENAITLEEIEISRNNSNRIFFKNKNIFYTEKGIYNSLVRNRQLSGWDKKEIINGAVRPVVTTTISYRGRKYTSYQDLCREYVIAYGWISILGKRWETSFMQMFTFVEHYFRPLRKNMEAMCRCPYAIINDIWFWTRDSLLSSLGLTLCDFNKAVNKCGYNLNLVLNYIDLHLIQLPKEIINGDSLFAKREFFEALAKAKQDGILDDTIECVM